MLRKKTMRRLVNVLIFISIFSFALPAYSKIEGGLKYNIPVDYSKIDETETSKIADNFYNVAIQCNGRLDDNVTSALNLYTILVAKDPTNIEYAVRLGHLYDIIGKNRYAKGNYYRAIGVDSSRPEPYFYLGEFYYKREQYRKSLKFYKEAYIRGYNTHSVTIDRILELNKKLGIKNSP